MEKKRVLIIIGSVFIILILGIYYGWILGIMFQKQENFMTEDDQFFYKISRKNCFGIPDKNENLKFAQIGRTVYFDFRSVDSYIILLDNPLIYNISKVDDHFILQISFYISNVYISCQARNHISGYLNNVFDLIDSVEFHIITIIEYPME